MASYSTSLLLGVILFCAKQALGYEVCNTIGTTDLYCDDGYYCCNYDLQCCSDGPSVGAWAGIIIGIIAFKVFVIVMCVRMCRRNRARPVMVNRPGPVVTTISSSSQYPATSGGFAPPTAYGQYPKAPMGDPTGAPPPYYAQ